MTKKTKKGLIIIWTSITIVMINLVSCKMDDELSYQEGTKENIHFMDVATSLKNVEPWIQKLDQESNSTRGLYERRVQSVANLSLPKVCTRNSDTSVVNYYIVNYENDEGFAIVASDDRDIPILAFSNTGHFDTSHLQDDCGLSDYMEYFNEMNQIYRESDSEYTVGYNPTISIPTIKTYGPYLTEAMSILGQGGLFKTYTPIIEDNRHAPVGCTAVAFVQYLSHYEYPSKIDDFDIDWQRIKSAKTNEDNEGVLLTAKLLQLVGQPEYLNLKYGLHSTSGNSYGLKNAFSKLNYTVGENGKFNPGIACEQLKKNNILFTTGRRYVLYRDSLGNALNRLEEGHAWIIDGVIHNQFVKEELVDKYKMYYFHCVWGWFGDSNGYYYYELNRENDLGYWPPNEYYYFGFKMFQLIHPYFNYLPNI